MYTCVALSISLVYDLGAGPCLDIGMAGRSATASNCFSSDESSGVVGAGPGSLTKAHT